MVRIDRLREDSEKRILRCSEGNSIWYQIWIDPGDMMRIEPLLEGGNRLWCIEIQKYYVFFYEVRKGRRILGKGRYWILFCSMNARDVLFSGFFGCCVLVCP